MGRGTSAQRRAGDRPHHRPHRRGVPQGACRARRGRKRPGHRRKRAGAHGAAVCVRHARGQRRGGDPLRASQAHGVPPLLRTLSRPLHQRHQRRDAAALAAFVRPGTFPAHRRAHRHGVQDRPHRAQGAGAAHRGHGGRVHGRQAAEKGAAFPVRAQARRRGAQSGLHVRRADQAPARVQAATDERFVHLRPLLRVQGGKPAGLHAHGLHLRCQVRARLRARQGHHLLHQPSGGNDQRRRRGAQGDAGGVR